MLIRSVSFIDLVIFAGVDLSIKKPKSELMFDFTFSGSYPKKNYKDQFFEVELNT